MVGVASPMLRRTSAGGARFLAGLVAGGAAAGLLLSLPAYLLGSLVHSVLPFRERIVLLAILCVGLGLADLTGRTPYLWRQVPESLFRKLPPGSLGLAWGFDLGLLFTTQKTTSLLWAAIAAVILLEPSAAAGALVLMSVAASLTVVIYSLTSSSAGNRREGQRKLWTIRTARRGSGLVMLMLVVASMVQALQA